MINEVRIHCQEMAKEQVDSIAEYIKDLILDDQDEEGTIVDVTYEIKESQ